MSQDNFFWKWGLNKKLFLQNRKKIFVQKQLLDFVVSKKQAFDTSLLDNVLGKLEIREIWLSDKEIKEKLEKYNKYYIKGKNANFIHIVRLVDFK